jgi:hypothetical protein
MEQTVGAAPAAETIAPSATPAAPQSAEDSVPIKPPVGAIQGALRAALPAARACVEPDYPISHALITFQSDGSAQSVRISGGAAGRPAEACIRAALMRARVPAFGVATYSAPVTIRAD